MKLLKVDGSIEEVEPMSSLEEIQKFVGGYVQVVFFHDGTEMWINEEGKLLGLPLNIEATAYWEERKGKRTDVIVGNAIVCKQGEMQ